MKLLPTYILFLITYSTFSQNCDLNKKLEDYFRDYSTSIINEDLSLELDLMYPALFENTSKEKIISDFKKDQLKKDTTQIANMVNYLVAIKSFSKPIKKRGKEYRIIDYILIKKITFTKEFYRIINKESTLSKKEKNKRGCNNHSRRCYTIQPLIFDEKKREQFDAFHKQILAIRNLNSKKWQFISDKWWYFQPVSKRHSNSGWTWNLKNNYKKKHISTINCFIPKTILKKMKKKPVYNSNQY